MNKQIRFIPALALGMAMLSIPTLATAEVIVNVLGATLIAKGAGAIVSIEVTCNPVFGDGSHVQMNGSITQRTGNGTTVGFLGVNDTLNCNGNPQSFDIVATVNSPGKPFKKGRTLISFGGTVFDPNFFSAEFGSFGGEIQIR